MNGKGSGDPTNLLDKVIRNLFVHTLHDPALQEMLQSLTPWVKILTSEPPDAPAGFVRSIADAHAEYLAIGKDKKLTDELQHLLNYFNSETRRLKKHHEACMSEPRAAGGPKAYLENKKKVIAQMFQDGSVLKEKIRKIEELLTVHGYTEEISDQSMHALEKKLQSLEQEHSRLQDHLEPFDDLEPTNNALERRIQQQKEEMERVESNLIGGTSFVQSFL